MLRKVFITAAAVALGMSIMYGVGHLSAKPTSPMEVIPETPVEPELKEVEKYYRIGVSIMPVPEGVRAHIDPSILGKGEGLFIGEGISENSPAAKSGLQEYDIITQVGESKVSVPGDLIKAVQESEGKELSLKVLRGGKSLDVKVTPEEAEKPAPRQPFHFEIPGIQIQGGNGAPIIIPNMPGRDLDKEIRKQMEEVRKQFKDQGIELPEIDLRIGDGTEDEELEEDADSSEENNEEPNPQIIRVPLQGGQGIIELKSPEWKAPETPKDTEKKLEGEETEKATPKKDAGEQKDKDAGEEKDKDAGEQKDKDAGEEKDKNAGIQVKPQIFSSFQASSISIQKNADGPATIKITTKKNGEESSYEVSEDNLDILPDDLRKQVERILRK